MGMALAKVFPMYIGVVEPAVWFMILGIGIVHWGLFAGVAVLVLALLPLLPLAISKARSEAPASP